MADKKTRHLSVRMTMHYGAMDIEFGLVEQVEVSSEMDQRRQYDLLYMQLQEQHNHFATELLPKIPNLALPISGASNNNVIGSRETYEAIELFRELKDGKEYFKFRTPQGTMYGKYGVNIWDEERAKYGIADMLGSAYKLPLTDVQIVVEKREKGSKVVEILNAANMALAPKGDDDVEF